MSPRGFFNKTHPFLKFITQRTSFMNIIIIIQPIFSLKGAYMESYLMIINIIRESAREKELFIQREQSVLCHHLFMNEERSSTLELVQSKQEAREKGVRCGRSFCCGCWRQRSQ